MNLWLWVVVKGIDRKFNMSYLATRMSLQVNGVSKLHGEVSRVCLINLWPGYLKDELFIGYVTNGVHYHTWLLLNGRKVMKNLQEATTLIRLTDLSGKDYIMLMIKNL
jgi:glucan phosphorylase